MLARDIMTRDVLTVHRSDRIDKVVKLMVDHRISGVPVVDEDNHVVGMVTEKDLMIKASDFKIPFYITLFDSIIFLENPIKFNEHLKKYTASKVEDVMTTRVYTVDEDAEVSEIVKLMTKKDINRVPVVRHQKLVGIITRNDIMKALVRQHE